MEHPLDEKSNMIQEVTFNKCIHQGQKFKNYHVFCQHLGIEEQKAGNTKKSQFKELRRYFDFHKIPGTQELMIDEVYDEVKPKPMRASNSRLKDMDKLICQRLYNGRLDDYVTYSKMAVILGMVNNAYSHIRYGDIIFQDDVLFDPCDGIYRDADAVFRLPEGRYKKVWRILIDSLINELHRSYRSSIKSTLDHLKSDGYIKVEENTMAKLHEGGVRIATYDECMLDFERELAALEAVDCANLNEVYRKGRFRKYTAEKKKRCSMHDDFEYLFPVVRITPQKQMDLSNFDAQTTYRKMSIQFLQNALKWKSVKSNQKMIFLLNRMLLPKPIWDYEMFELLWQTNMPRDITKEEWPQHLGWLTDRETCKFPNFT